MNKEELLVKDKIYEETQEFGRTQFVDEIYKLREENKWLKFFLNDAVFSEFNDDVELAARYLRRLNYIDFDEENQIYINKHNEEPLCRPEAREKHFFIEDDDVDDYVKQIENENLILKKRIKEALDILDKFPALDLRDDTKNEKLMKLLEIKNLLNEVINK